MQDTFSAAGFWLRAAAMWLDGLLLYVLVWVVAKIAAEVGVYVPFELTFLLLAVVGSVLMVRWWGATPGKACCGIAVLSARGGRVSWGQALVRETFGKLLAALPLLLGFLWVGLTGRKRGWHDALARTVVVRRQGRRRAVTGMMAVLAAVTATAYVGAYAWQVGQLVLVRRAMALPPTAVPRYANRDPATLHDIATFDSTQQQAVAAWIDEHGADPVDYAVAKAQQHQVVIFGEMHEGKQALELLAAMLPRLYHEAGVTCLAMEVCLSQDDEALQCLVTAPSYDRELALRLARHQPFGLWGWKEYWDVLETVWQLNQSIPSGGKKMRVVGLDRPMDMPSISLVMGEDNAASRFCPWWEKLRVARLPWAFPLLVGRDAWMAQQVEQQILDRDERGIVWVGRNHTAMHVPGLGGPRMGYLLGQRHGDKLFQVCLHSWDIPAKFVVPDYQGPGPAMADVLEQIMALRADRPVGFDVIGSPVECVRDPGSMEYCFEPRLDLGDVAEGFIYLGPCRKLEHCQWMDDYVSPRMFAADKPFYQAFGLAAGLPVDSAADFNHVMRQP
ncbi:MAG: RDD family protein [Phycisphaeraceae bacterium]|nr:RDD family protein [Phycisphaeraceae bacterium]